MTGRPLSLVALALVALTPLRAADAAADAERAAATIEPAALSGLIRFLSSDLLEGRGPGSRGDQLARGYLASQLESLGFEPAGTNGTFQQTFEMVGLKNAAPAGWTFRAGGTNVDLAWHEDYIGSTGVQRPAAGFPETEVVFVGYGIQAPEYGWDDFKGADLRGKVLLMLNNDPDWDDALFAGVRRLFYGRWVYKYESAARQGAAAAIIVHTTPSAGYPWQVVQTSWGGEQFELPAGDEPRLLFKAWATEEATRRMLGAAGQDLDKLVALARSRDFHPVPLGIRTAFETANAVRRIETGNVLGLLRGSDPKLRDEVVVYTAHHDHLGVGAPDTHGDTIYNGAIDNATGCGQLVALARAFKALPAPPRRSILFAFVAAEEQGLLGSAYLAQHLPVPAGRIAANVNFDAGNVFGRTRDITYIGYGKSTLDRVVEAEAAKQGRTVRGDQYPDRGSFYRSDQFNFARIGVPALYLGGGTDYIGKDPEFGRNLRKTYESTCYHQPCDEMRPDWDLSGLVEDTRVGFGCGLAIADADAMPAWNPGDEFEAARLAALAAVAGR
jgi:Zn-dependent M28 family amino/carboxypeptidase